MIYKKVTTDDVRGINQLVMWLAPELLVSNKAHSQPWYFLSLLVSLHGMVQQSVLLKRKNDIFHIKSGCDFIEFQCTISLLADKLIMIVLI